MTGLSTDAKAVAWAENCIQLVWETCRSAGATLERADARNGDYRLIVSFPDGTHLFFWLDSEHGRVSVVDAAGNRYFRFTGGCDEFCCVDGEIYLGGGLHPTPLTEVIYTSPRIPFERTGLSTAE
jgi:hypothetical protein